MNHAARQVMEKLQGNKIEEQYWCPQCQRHYYFYGTSEATLREDKKGCPRCHRDGFFQGHMKL